MLTPESVIPWLEGKPTVASILEQHQTDSARVAELDGMLTREIDAAIKKEDLIHRYHAALVNVHNRVLAALELHQETVEASPIHTITSEALGL